MTEPQLVPTSRGGHYLSFGGYLYHKQNKSKDKTYWICREKPICNGRATTTSDPLTIIKASCEEEHTHAPNPEAAKAAVIRDSLKRKAEDRPKAGPSRLIRDELSGVPSEILSELPQQESLRRMMNNKRQSQLSKNPMKLTDLTELPDEYKKTEEGERFLLY